MPERDIIVIGGSAGGLEALTQILAKLPHDIAAAIFVVIHLSPDRESLLPNILTRVGRIQAAHPHDGESIRHRHIYVAPPDHHVIIQDGRVRVVHGPRENRARPAIDPLFRSAAVSYGARVIGVILSGSLDDGTAGLRAIKSTGGITIVQDPADASYPAMPRSAIDNTSVDFIVRADEIAPLLRSLVAEETLQLEVPAIMKGDLRKEIDIVEQRLQPDEMIEAVSNLGQISMFTCPECQGALWEIKDGELLRYRCHVGHAYSIESLDADHSEKLESALWSALRALEERGEMARRLADQCRQRRRDRMASVYESRANEADEHAQSIRQMLIKDPDKPLMSDTTASSAESGSSNH